MSTAAPKLGSALDNPVDLLEILKEAKTIAVVGCSSKRTRPSHSISRYLLQNGYRIIPVNPNYEVIHDQPCYPDLASVPLDVVIDIINVFRNPRSMRDVVRAAVERSDRTSRKPVIWTQLGVSTPEAERMATEAGFPYVANRCILREHVAMR